MARPADRTTERARAAEREVWTTAALLIGDADAAWLPLAEALEQTPDILKAGESRLRLGVVRAAREIRAERAGAPGGLADRLGPPGPARDLWLASLELPDDQREAWVLVDALGLTPDEASHATGADAPAALVAARAALADAAGPSWRDAVAPLREALSRLDPGEGLRRAESARAGALRRSRLVSALTLAVLFVCFGLMIFVLVDLLGWSDRRDAFDAERARLSNPIVEEGADGAGAPDPAAAEGGRGGPSP